MNFRVLYMSFFCLIELSSCTKSDFLSTKPNSSIVVPKTLIDMTQLLDNSNVLNAYTPSLPFLSADEYFLPSIEALNALTTKTEKNSYLWKTDIFQGETNIPDWNGPYAVVFYANVVLEQWEKLNEVDKVSEQGKYIKGWALFARGFAFFNLVQTFATTYDQKDAAQKEGIPLRLSPDVNEIKQRSTLKETYDQILNDLDQSKALMNNSFPAKNLNRPSKAAVFALLSRVNLYMRNYKLSGIYADSALKYAGSLLDYNSVNVTASSPFTLYNQELIFYTTTSYTYFTVVVGNGSPSSISPELVNLFDENDLRKPIYFRNDGHYYFMKRGYNGAGGYPFSGLAVDEIYLNKCEVEARNGNPAQAVAILNRLLEKRYKTGTFMAYKPNRPEDVLPKILLERRKELVWRGIRWSDIKRLNMEGANISLTRTLDGETYTLPPNDPKYVMPIPDDEIALSHIEQNNR